MAAAKFHAVGRGLLLAVWGRTMKKTTTEKQDTKTTKLVVRKERVRELQTPDLEHVVGGIWNYRSLQSSCC